MPIPWSSEIHQLFTNVSLTVTSPFSGSPGKTPLFLERFEEITVKEKGTIRLCARVQASPAPNIVWFRNNKPLLASPRKHESFDGENIILELKVNNVYNKCRIRKIWVPVLRTWKLVFASFIRKNTES